MNNSEQRSPLPFRKVLVGLTCSDADAELIRYAGMLARGARDTGFQFVHVLGTPESSATLEPAEAHDEIRASVQAHFGAEEHGMAWSCNVVEGSRVDGLLKFALREGNDLILIGHRQIRTGRRSLARRLAMNAPCSLWMVPAGSHSAITRVMAAVDFSSHSARALSAAGAVCASAGAEQCMALNVYFNDIAIAGGKTVGELKQIYKAEFDRFMQPLELHDVSLKPMLEESLRVPAAIIRIAKRHGVDLIVMGTRGRSPSAAILLGSETEQMIMETRTPILIVKALGERLGVLEVLLRPDRRKEPVLAG